MRRSYRFFLTQLPDTEVMHRHDSWYLAQLSDDGFAPSARWCASKQDVSTSKSCLCQSIALYGRRAYSLRGRALLAIIIAMPMLTAGSAQNLAGDCTSIMTRAAVITPRLFSTSPRIWITIALAPKSPCACLAEGLSCSSQPIAVYL